MSEVSAIRINTKLKTDGIARDRKLIQNELKALERDAEKIRIEKDIKINTADLDKTVKKIKAVEDQYNSLDAKLTEMRAKAAEAILADDYHIGTADNAGYKATLALPDNASQQEKDLAYQKARNAYMEKAINQEMAVNAEYQKGLVSIDEMNIKLAELNALEEEQSAKALELQNAQILNNVQLGIQEEALKGQLSDLNAQDDAVRRRGQKEIESVKNAHDLKGAIDQQGKSIQKGLRGMMKMAGAVIGVRAAYSAVRKMVNHVIADNELLKNTLDGIWSALGNAFEPIISSVIQGFATMLNYALAILNALTGINLLSKKAKKASGSGGAKKDGDLASFDSSEVLKKDSGGGAGGANASLLEEIKLNEDILAVLDRIKAMWSKIGFIVGNIGSAIGVAWKHAGNGERIMKSLGKMAERLLKFFENIVDITLDWSETINFIPLLSAIAPYMEENARAFDNLLTGVEWFYKNIVLGLVSFAIEDGLPAFFDLLTASLSVLNGVFETLMPVWEWFWDNLLQPIASWTGGAIVTILTTLADALRDIGSWFTDNASEIHDTLIELGERLVWLWEEIIRPVLDLIKLYWQVTWAFIGGLLKGFLDAAIGVINAVIGVFDGLITFLEGIFSLNIEKALNGVKMIFANIWNAIISIVEGAINGIIYGVNSVIRALNKISIKMPSWLGGGTFGFSLEEMEPADLSKYKIPALATGAVLQPNNPFIAMLGDQTTGRNIETPEALLRQIMREENGGDKQIVLNLIAEGNLGELIRFLKFKLLEEDNREGIRMVEEGT